MASGLQYLTAHNTRLQGAEVRIVVLAVPGLVVGTAAGVGGATACEGQVALTVASNTQLSLSSKPSCHEILA